MACSTLLFVSPPSSSHFHRLGAPRQLRMLVGGWLFVFASAFRIFCPFFSNALDDRQCFIARSAMRKKKNRQLRMLTLAP